MLAVIGEMFDFPDEICGAVVSLRNKRNRLALWTRTAINEPITKRIGAQWKALVETDCKLEYQVPTSPVACRERVADMCVRGRSTRTPCRRHHPLPTNRDIACDWSGAFDHTEKPNKTITKIDKTEKTTKTKKRCRVVSGRLCCRGTVLRQQNSRGKPNKHQSPAPCGCGACGALYGPTLAALTGGFNSQHYATFFIIFLLVPFLSWFDTQNTHTEAHTTNALLPDVVKAGQWAKQTHVQGGLLSEHEWQSAMTTSTWLFASAMSARRQQNGTGNGCRASCFSLAPAALHV